MSLRYSPQPAHLRPDLDTVLAVKRREELGKLRKSVRGLRREIADLEQSLSSDEKHLAAPIVNSLVEIEGRVETMYRRASK